MVNHRKGFTATQSKITSRRLRTATLGTHMPRRSARHMNGDSVGFSSPRKQKRAARGYVESVLPTASGGGSSKYSHRVSRREYSQGIQRRARMKRVGILLACVLVVGCVGFGVGIATFFGSLDAKLALKDSNVSSALVAPNAQEAFYTVVAADLDPAGSANAQEGPDALALVRVDTASRAATVVSVPSNLQVSLSDGKVHPLREATTLGGDAALVGAIASSAGVSVSHYVKIDAAGIVRLVDELGGIEVNVAEEVDDPAAGNVYIPSGLQTLDGQTALTFLRASNFADALETQTANQRELLTALSLNLVNRGSFDLLSLMDVSGGPFGTDVSVNDIRGLAESLHGMDASTTKGALLPGYEKTSGEVDYYVASSAAWTAMMERVAAGEDPETQDVLAAVDPGSFTLTLRNGGGITGAAAQMTATLQGLGFNVTETGNTDTSVYTETLVIYKDGAYEAAAQTVLSTLGVGRAVSGGEFYTFDTDVLVILGKDWKPAA